MKPFWLVFAVCLAGCQSVRKPIVMPPIPQAMKTRAARTAQVEAVILPPAALKLTWEYPYPDPVTFEVWASEDLTNWILATNTLSPYVAFPVKPMEFFRVRAVDPATGSISDWGTTK